MNVHLLSVLRIIIDCVVTSWDIQTIQDCLWIVFVDREVRLSVFFCRWLATCWHRNDSYLRLSYFQRLSATSGGHMSWPTTVTTGALSSFQSNGVGREFFFLSKRDFTTVTHCGKVFWIWYCGLCVRNVVNLVQVSDGILILVDRGNRFAVKLPEIG
jgi:hypothetical protein